MVVQPDKLCPNCHKQLIKMGFILRCTCGWWVYLEENNQFSSEPATQTEPQTLVITSG
ncbi:MAG: hypothetical protein GF308_01665 [Candidatus Heimdallarchaeota archaeon]|nr:hypothetical protein [Candidatus Heimdallarchaeota archaeon]